MGPNEVSEGQYFSTMAISLGNKFWKIGHITVPEVEDDSTIWRQALVRMDLTSVITSEHAKRGT